MNMFDMYRGWYSGTGRPIVDRYVISELLDDHHIILVHTSTVQCTEVGLLEVIIPSCFPPVLYISVLPWLHTVF